MRRPSWLRLGSRDGPDAHADGMHGTQDTRVLSMVDSTRKGRSHTRRDMERSSSGSSLRTNTTVALPSRSIARASLPICRRRCSSGRVIFSFSRRINYVIPQLELRTYYARTVRFPRAS